MPPRRQRFQATIDGVVYSRRAAIARRPIVAAADQCQEFYLRKFLAEGVCPNDHIHGWTPLLKLCGQEQYREGEDAEEVLACVDAVLEAGADANLVSQFGEFQSRSISPLELAAGLKLPWDLGPCEPRPMPRVVARLIKAGADVDAIDEKEWSVVAYAASLGWSTLVQWDNATDSAQFQTRLRWIVKPGREFFVVVGQNLDTKPGDIRVRETQPTAKVRWTFRF